MKNSFKFLGNCIILCFTTFVLSSLIGSYADNFTSGFLAIYKDMIWMSIMLPDFLGSYRDIFILLFNNLLFFSVTFFVMTIGLWLSLMKNINSFNFWLSVLSLFLLNVFLLIATYTVTKDLTVFTYIKFFMVVIIYYFMFKFRSLFTFS